MTKTAAANATAAKEADRGADTGPVNGTEKSAVGPEAAPGIPAAPACEVVLFGLDPAGKAHASRFAVADAALAIRAAAIMGYRVLPVTTADHLAAASGLPVGRVFASGRGFVPFCAKAAYDRLQAFGEAYAPEPPAAPAGGPGAPGGAGDMAGAGGDGAAPAVAATTTPATWGDIAVGGLALASEGDGQGWYEAVVTEDRGEDILVLRWRDWPDTEPFPRRREHLALLPTVAEATKAVDAAAAQA